jgi:pSer/pThr/pTyr-binding forkhead associated (FHA) protein
MSSIGKLIVYSTKRRKLAEYKLGDQVFLIGRGEANDLTISDPLVSSHHCKISPTMLEPLLEDMNSTNGTYVNFKRVKNHALKDQDIIMFKHFLIKFMQDPNVAIDHPTTEIPEDTITSLETWWSHRNDDEGKAQISVTVHQKGV